MKRTLNPMINRSKSEKDAGHYAFTNAAGRGVSVSLSYDGSYVTNMVYVLPNGNTFVSAATVPFFAIVPRAVRPTFFGFPFNGP